MKPRRERLNWYELNTLLMMMYFVVVVIVTASKSLFTSSCRQTGLHLWHMRKHIAVKILKRDDKIELTLDNGVSWRGAQPPS